MNRRMAVCVMSASIAIASAAALVAKDRLDMRLRDDCDPATFNAAVGPGTCVGGGDTTFQAFLAEFTATGQVVLLIADSLVRSRAIFAVNPSSSPA